MKPESDRWRGCHCWRDFSTPLRFARNDNNRHSNQRGAWALSVVIPTGGAVGPEAEESHVTPEMTIIVIPTGGAAGPEAEESRATLEMTATILFGGIWHAQMRECLARCLAPFRGAVDETLLEEEGLVDVLDGIDFLA